jgi:putative hydrolase
MTAMGFTPDDSDENKPNEPENSADFAAMMKDMQEKIAEQFQNLGVNADFNPLGFISQFTQGASSDGATRDALPKNIVADTAKKFVQAHGSSPIGANDVAQIQEALSIAELWLDDATFFSRASTLPSNSALSRIDWINATLPGWQNMVEPLAGGFAGAISELLDDAMQAQAGEGEAEALNIPVGAIAGLLRSFIGSLMATQLGQSVGGLSAGMTGAHDVGLPLLDPAYPALVPQNINEWGKDLDIPMEEVRIFHALREAAIARLFAHNPWLVSYIRSAVTEYGKGIRIDIEAIQRQAQDAFESAQDNGEFDPTNPESFSLALNKGIFTPEETPAQKSALTKLETALALIDGWADEVSQSAAGNRLPHIGALSETLRRRRATSAPAQQLFSSLFGLEVSPRLTREAKTFWKKVLELTDIQSRDRIWAGFLPTAEDLSTPEVFIASTTIPDDLSNL